MAGGGPYLGPPLAGGQHENRPYLRAPLRENLLRDIFASRTGNPPLSKKEFPPPAEPVQAVSQMPAPTIARVVPPVVLSAAVPAEMLRAMPDAVPAPTLIALAPEPIIAPASAPAIAPAAPAETAPTRERPAIGKSGLRCKRCGSRDVWRFGRITGMQFAMANVMKGQWATCRGCGKRFITKFYGPMPKDDDFDQDEAN
jgi:DNA-directed RNA polymerase subunit RPC12/RpoP